MKRKNNVTTHNFYLPIPDELIPLGDIVNGVVAACVKDIIHYKTDVHEEPDYCHSYFEYIFDWYSSIKPDLTDEHKYDLTLYTLDCLSHLFAEPDELSWYFSHDITTVSVYCRLYKGYIKLMITYYYNEMNHEQTYISTGTYV